VRETLKTHQVNTIVLPTDSGLALRIRKGTTPEPAHRELYAKLGIEPEVIRPRKNWTRGRGHEIVTEKRDKSLLFNSPFLKSAEVGLVPRCAFR